MNGTQSGRPESQKAGIALAAGGLVSFIGLLLPWATVSFSAGTETASISQNGIGTSDGKIILVLAIVLGVLAARIVSGKVGQPKWYGIGGLVAAALILVVGIIDIADINSKVGDGDTLPSSLDAGVGFGLYLTVIGGALALIGSILTLRLKPSPDAAPMMPPAPPETTTPPVPPAGDPAAPQAPPSPPDDSTPPPPPMA